MDLIFVIRRKCMLFQLIWQLMFVFISDILFRLSIEKELIYLLVEYNLQLTKILELTTLTFWGLYEGSIRKKCPIENSKDKRPI